MERDLARLERYRELIDDWPGFVDASQRALPTVIWANPLRGATLRRLQEAQGIPVPDGRSLQRGDDPQAVAATMLAARLGQRGYRSEAVGWCPGALRLPDLDKPGLTLEYHLGLYHVQEEISLVPVRVLDPAPGERVLDVCASPGGKTAQIACSMEGRGTVVANDLRAERLRALRGNSERLGLLNVAVCSHDGTRFPLEAGPFDRILLDAPCSCEGNLRQQGDVASTGSQELLTGRSGLQATLLGRIWKLLRPGGVLVYATCTFAPEENEMVLDHILGADAELLPVDVPGLLSAPGVTSWRGRELRHDCANVARYWPHLNDTGGFSVALVRKAPS